MKSPSKLKNISIGHIVHIAAGSLKLRGVFGKCDFMCLCSCLFSMTQKLSLQHRDLLSWVLPPLSLADPCLAPDVSLHLPLHLGGSDSQYDDKVLWLATISEANLLRANYRLGNREGKTCFPPVYFRAIFHCPRVLRAQHGAAQKTWLRSHSAKHIEFQEAGKLFIPLEVVWKMVHVGEDKN